LWSLSWQSWPAFHPARMYYHRFKIINYAAHVCFRLFEVVHIWLMRWRTTTVEQPIALVIHIFKKERGKQGETIFPCNLPTIRSRRVRAVCFFALLSISNLGIRWDIRSTHKYSEWKKYCAFICRAWDNDTGWKQNARSMYYQVSFAKVTYKNGALFQKRPGNLVGSVQIVAIP